MAKTGCKKPMTRRGSEDAFCVLSNETNFPIIDGRICPLCVKNINREVVLTYWDANLELRVAIHRSCIERVFEEHDYGEYSGDVVEEKMEEIREREIARFFG